MYVCVFNVRNEVGRKWSRHMPLPFFKLQSSKSQDQKPRTLSCIDLPHNHSTRSRSLHEAIMIRYNFAMVDEVKEVERGKRS